MYVVFDPANHALLLHLGAAGRRGPLRLETWQMQYTPSCLTRVEMGFDAESGALVALHFTRRSFFMPSFATIADLTARWVFGQDERHVYIQLGAVPKPHDPVWIRPGLELFLSLPQRTGRARPFLHGLRIDRLIAPCELEMPPLDIRVASGALENGDAGSLVRVSP
jgi:hypothetical protein